MFCFFCCGYSHQYIVYFFTTGLQLYLASDKVTFQKCAKKSRHQEVYFVPQPIFLTQWMVQHKNPLLRLEYEHEPVEVCCSCCWWWLVMVGGGGTDTTLLIRK